MKSLDERMRDKEAELKEKEDSVKACKKELNALKRMKVSEIRALQKKTKAKQKDYAYDRLTASLRLSYGKPGYEMSDADFEYNVNRMFDALDNAWRKRNPEPVQNEPEAETAETEINEI